MRLLTPHITLIYPNYEVSEVAEPRVRECNIDSTPSNDVLPTKGSEEFLLYDGVFNDVDGWGHKKRKA